MMEVGVYCSGYHPNGPKRAWLCITDRITKDRHHHVCGIHARSFLRARDFDTVFRTIDPGNEARYPWLSGRGCRKATAAVEQ